MKNSSRNGYRLALITDKPEVVEKKVKSIIDSAQVEAVSGGSVLVSIPRAQVEDIVKLLGILESEEIEEIADWGFSNSTLEEVFMEITDASG